MFRIMKSVLYRFRKEWQFPWIVFGLMFLTLLALMALEVINENVGGITEVLGGSMSLAFAGLEVFFCLFICNQICAGDFLEKTIYLEIMSGQSRKNLFLARLAVCVLVSYVGGALMILCSLFVGQFLFPWGVALTWKGIMIRCLLMFFPMVKLCCETVAIFFILGPGLGKMSFGVIGCAEIIRMFLNPNMVSPVTNIISMYNLSTVFSCITHETYTLEDLTPIRVYTDRVSKEVVLSTIVCSLVISVLCCVVVYGYFSKDDLN